MSIWGINIKKYNLFLADICFFLISLYLALSLRRVDFVSLEYFLLHVKTFFVVYIIFVIGMYIMGMYDVIQLNSVFKKLKSIFYAAISCVLLGNTFFYLFHNDYTPKTVLIIQLFLLVIFTFLFRISGETKSKIKIALVACDEYKNEIENIVNKNNSLEIDIKSQNIINDFDKYSDKNITEMLKSSGVDILVVDLSSEKTAKIFPSIYDISKLGIKIVDINNFYEMIFKKAILNSIGYNWFFKEVRVDTKLYEFVKRCIDLLLCIPIFILWALLHPWVYFNIKKDDGKEIYSLQERVGRYNKKIIIKKYRTMTFTDAGVWQEESENKVTVFGSFLRKTRIDELPQVFSVIKGDMSFIGPRTDNINLWKNLEGEIDNYNLRYSVTPGLSGWAQVNMDYQPRTVEDTRERFKYDLYYLKHRSVILDFIIMLKTIKTVLGREGS